MNRRDLLVRCAYGALVGPSAYLATKYVAGKPATDWVAKWRARLPEVSKVIANAELRQERLCADVIHNVPWHDGVTLLVHKAGQSSAMANFHRTRGLLRAGNYETLAVGWSEDRTAWAQFVLADSAHVQRALAGHPVSCQVFDGRRNVA